MSPAQAKVALDVLDNLLEGCQVIDFTYAYRYVNDTVARQAQTSPDRLLGRTMMECFPGIEQTAMFAQLERCMADRTHHRMDNEFRLPDGSIGAFELQFVPVPEGVCILSVDVTQQRRLQHQLEQAQKMDAIGRLAAGVAHDFNNMLSVILSYGEMLKKSLAGDARADDAAEIVKAGERAAELTAQLLAVSRQQPVQAKVIDLNDAITAMEKMLQRLIRKNVVLKTSAKASQARVKSDPGQVEQILLNLAVNARDAMPRGGTLTIETANVDLDHEFTAQHLGMSPGPHVMLAVSDTGIGMDRATQARIFEPFFTTKPVGKGTGLGLATVFGIVQQNRGTIWVYSELGKGTTFKVYFPAAAVASDAGRAAASAPSATLAHRETILVVEDDEQLRRLACRLLERQGYQVVVSETPSEALGLIRTDAENGKRIALVLTDVMLPEMNGRELALRITEAWPHLKILYMSGYTGDAAVHQGLLESGAKLVPKPLTPSALESALRELLG